MKTQAAILRKTGLRRPGAPIVRGDVNSVNAAIRGRAVVPTNTAVDDGRQSPRLAFLKTAFVRSGNAAKQIVFGGGDQSEVSRDFCLNGAVKRNFCAFFGKFVMFSIKIGKKVSFWRIIFFPVRKCGGLFFKNLYSQYERTPTWTKIGVRLSCECGGFRTLASVQ